jgi:hypothetical protein
VEWTVKNPCPVWPTSPKTSVIKESDYVKVM